MVKTWKTSEDSQTGMQIGDTHAEVVVGSGGITNGLYVDESGTYLSGKMSILASPDQIRLGGLWCMNSPWMLMFPSTMAFPIPTLMISPPISGITKMATQVAWAMSMLL
jgi:hypothetical protein